MEVTTEENAQCKVEQSPRQDSHAGLQEREVNCKMERKEQRDATPTDSQEANDTLYGHDAEQDEQNEQAEHDQQPMRKSKQVIELKQEEPCKRGYRKKIIKEKPKPKPKSSKKKKKQTRQMKPIEKDDPRYRGVPKIKRIRKRRNKPKPISEQAKKEAEIKKEEQEYNRKITNRGRKPVITRLRGQKKRKELQKELQDSSNLKLEEDKKNVKLEQSEEQMGSHSSKEDNDPQTRGTKRRISRKQKQKERDEDKRKVDSIMKARGERERRQQIQTMVRMQRMLAVKFGKKILLQIDPSCKYYSQYKFRKNEIEKGGKLYCQIYNKHPMPASGKHFFQVKIARLSFQSVTIGVITANNFDQQYSRDKSQCICFDAYTHSTYVQGQKTELQVEVKLNDIIRTIVDIPNSNVHWYLNNDFISQAIIPTHMAAVPLYPYMQVSNKWIKMRINEFQQ